MISSLLDAGQAQVWQFQRLELSELPRIKLDCAVTFLVYLHALFNFLLKFVTTCPI
jgi:hypothetical protein